MKIGILTFHNAYNYGAVLQAYALQSYLEQKGFDVEVIDYHNPKVDEAYVIFRWRSFFRKNIVKDVIYFFNALFRRNLFSCFKTHTHRILRLSKRIVDLQDPIITNKDVIVVGSDQLWNKKITGTEDPFYWAKFNDYNHVRAITYAVCMNTDHLTSENYSFIKKNLDNFSAISVRETSLAETLASLTTQKIHVSLDPTLLIEPVFWKNIAEKEGGDKRKPYVLVYAILEREKVIACAKQFAGSINLPLIIMSPIADAKLFNNNLQPDSPFGFVSAIAHANYVITSSFHGLAFSVIFHKNVWVLGNAGKNERMRSLLNALGIGDRFIDDSRQLTGNKIDYSAVEKKLYTLRKESQDYLITAING